VADSWVGPGPNKQVAPPQLEKAIGPDVLTTLSEQTGLTRDEILARLSKNLPDAVDKYTPEGRIPAAAEHGKSRGFSREPFFRSCGRRRAASRAPCNQGFLLFT
jgi:uncharacterized protein YidB (DUF937 family)